MEEQVMIPMHLQDKVDRELEADERIEWIDMPVAAFFTPGSISAFLFGIPWTAFALFWTAGAAQGVSQSGGPGLFSLFPLFGLPFILIGLGMLSSPIWAYRKARKTVYVITDRRAIIFDGGWSTTIRSYQPDQLRKVYREVKGNGTGNVIFSSEQWRDSDGDSRSRSIGFMRIRYPKEVERLIKELAGVGVETKGDD